MISRSFWRSLYRIWRPISRSQPGLRILGFLLSLGLIWAPFAIPIYGLGGRLSPNIASIVALIVLYLIFLQLAWHWRHCCYQDSTPFQSYGLKIFQVEFWVSWSLGIGLGILSTIVLFGLQLYFRLATISTEAQITPGLLATAATVAIAIGFAEELLFRGWLLQELIETYSWRRSIIVSSVIFAIAHFIKPWSEILASLPQFGGLVLLGITLSLCKYADFPAFTACFAPVQPDLLQSQSDHRSAAAPADSPHQPQVCRPSWMGSLGWPMGLHAGLVGGYYIVDVSDLMIPNVDAAPWLIGINQNPLAGIMGMGLLLGLAIGFYQLAIATQSQQSNPSNS